MYFFTPDTISQANKNINDLDSKVGGLLCLLHCLTDDIEENISYTIDGERLRRQLSQVFDKEPKNDFENAKPSYIIFAKDWISTFFDTYIKKKVDLLSCAVFFLRRYSFEKECTKDEIIDIFVNRFNLKELKENWFENADTLSLSYNQHNVEENQAEFYRMMGYTANFKSLLFGNVIQKSASDLKAAGQIQTLYSGSSIHTCLLLSDEPLDKYYIMHNSNQKKIMCSVEPDLSFDMLVAELKRMCTEPKDSGKVAAIHMFAIKYAEQIIKNGYKNKDLAIAAGINESYDVEINKGLNIYKSIKENEYNIHFYEEKTTEKVMTEKERFDFNNLTGDATNKIYFGVPGCGKSYHIEHKILGKDVTSKEYKGKYDKDKIIRTTFYQDYSNTDFVGQILPKITKDDNGKDKVEYIFNPGPFTLALIQAIKAKDDVTDTLMPLKKKVALVIEEINRGNAPAIFGDIFQLLDRDDDGISEYGIVNVGVIDYLNGYNFGTENEPIYYTFDEIKIPGNMDIFATMNTSDQNVYTLDTAFTRRWEKERIANKFESNSGIAKYYVPGITGCTWKEFVDKINLKIQSSLDDLQINEDKQVGCYFVRKKDLLEKYTEAKDVSLEKKRYFAYKVLQYLWDDVTKLEHSVIFNPSYKTFDELVDAYVEKGSVIFNESISFNIDAPKENNDGQ